MSLNNRQRSIADLPIGVFDSGMGGLTVLRELRKSLPNESFVYLGDTARLPYGTKSPETVKRYANQMASILVEQKIKLLVVACNTASTVALPHLIERFPDLPIVGVVEPGALAAIKTTKNNRIALLATETTVASGIYQQTIQSFNSEIDVVSQSCSLFVALAEEGCINDEIANIAVKQYLKPITQHKNPCDTVILGCTHFPVLIETISAALGANINIINSAEATANTVKLMLSEMNLHNLNSGSPTISFLVTDLPERFIRVGESFLGHPIQSYAIQLVDGILSLNSQSSVASQDESLKPDQSPGLSAN